MTKRKTKTPRTVISRDYLMKAILRLQACTKMLAAAESAGEFRKLQLAITNLANSLSVWDDATIERSFPRGVQPTDNPALRRGKTP